MSEENTNNGAFIGSLKRNNKQIRDDRAIAIAEGTELLYKRQVEDLQVTLKQMVREQDNMMDLSPHHADSLVLASDFDSKDYVNKDVELGVRIRNTEIKLEIAQKRFGHLFGGAL